MVKAIMTLYNPGHDVISNIQSILPQVDQLFLWDNSSTGNRSSFTFDSKIIYRTTGKNLALSGAFNSILKDENYGWNNDDFVIFFDQDSFIKEGHIQQLIDEYKRLLNLNCNVGCLGPVYYNINMDQTKLPKDKTYVTENSFTVKSIITSSMVVRYGDIKKIGFWNEKIFLDMADWDLCWRFIKADYKCVETTASVLKHHLGTGGRKIGLLYLRKGAVFREYYQTRNSLYLLHEKYTPLKFKIRFIYNMIIRFPLRLIFLENRKERLHYFIAGIVDFKKGLTGEYLGK